MCFLTFIHPFEKYLLSAYLCEALFVLESLVCWDTGVAAGCTHRGSVYSPLTALGLGTPRSYRSLPTDSLQLFAKASEYVLHSMVRKV